MQRVYPRSWSMCPTRPSAKATASAERRIGPAKHSSIMPVQMMSSHSNNASISQKLALPSGLGLNSAHFIKFCDFRVFAILGFLSWTHLSFYSSGKKLVVSRYSSEVSVNGWIPFVLFRVFFFRCQFRKIAAMSGIRVIVLEAQWALFSWILLISGRFDRNNTGGASVFNFFHNEDEVRFSPSWIHGRIGKLFVVFVSGLVIWMTSWFLVIVQPYLSWFAIRVSENGLLLSGLLSFGWLTASS